MDADKLRRQANDARDEAAEWFQNFGDEVSAVVKDEGGRPCIHVTIKKLKRSIDDVPRRFNQVPIRIHVVL
jgi:hypothetical protein